MRTTGPFNIAIVGVNEPALFATENVVLARSGFESPPTMLEIYCRDRKRRKQNNHVGEDQCFTTHRALAVAGPVLVDVTTHQLKTIRPMAGAAAARTLASRIATGSNSNKRANCTAC